MAWRHLAPSRMLVGPLHRFEFAVDVELLSGFEHEHLHALRREYMCRHSSRGAGAHDHSIVGRLQINVRWRGLFETNKRHWILRCGVRGQTPVVVLHIGHSGKAKLYRTFPAVSAMYWRPSIA